MVTSLRSAMARRSPSQLSGNRLVNAITARSNDPGTRAPKEEVPLSVDPAVRELIIASFGEIRFVPESALLRKTSRSRVDLSGRGGARMGFWRRRGDSNPPYGVTRITV